MQRLVLNWWGHWEWSKLGQVCTKMTSKSLMHQKFFPLSVSEGSKLCIKDYGLLVLNLYFNAFNLISHNLSLFVTAVHRYQEPHWIGWWSDSSPVGCRVGFWEGWPADSIPQLGTCLALNRDWWIEVRDQPVGRTELLAFSYIRREKSFTFAKCPSYVGTVMRGFLVLSSLILQSPWELEINIYL
jgi:hypothetical protein